MVTEARLPLPFRKENIHNETGYKRLKINIGGEKGAWVCKKSHAAHVFLVLHLGSSIVSAGPRMLVGSFPGQRGGIHKMSRT